MNAEIAKTTILAAAMGLMAVSAQATTIPTTTFDWNPRPLGLNGSKFTADTVQLSDFGQININPATGAFSEAGYLPLIGFSLGGQAISPTGFDDPTGAGWGAYVQYQATGTQSFTAQGLAVSYSTLSYSLYGFNGLVSYGLNPTTGAAFATGGSNLQLLGDGSLIDGSLLVNPATFAAQGDIQATIADVPHQFSSNTFLGFDLNLLHPAGEITPISPTTFEVHGGTSSTATLLASHGNSSHGLVSAFVLSDATDADPATTVPEPGSALLLLGLLAPVSLVLIRRQG